MDRRSIAVIIPTFNEEEFVVRTVKKIIEADDLKMVQQIIIADGGSTDRTLQRLSNCPVEIVKGPAKGRAAQMNFGAGFATAEVLYFLHADTLPPHKFSKYISGVVDTGCEAGCFTLAFDHPHWFLKANAWFTRFDVDSIRFGDQSLFVTNNLFKKAGGFNESHILLEDQEIVKRLKNAGKFTIIKIPVTTSARKYLENGVYKTQLIYFIIYFMYQLHFSQDKLVSMYCRLIRKNKFKTDET